MRRRALLIAAAGLPALGALRARAGVLDEVRSKRRLRVASTFDYRPFSYRADGRLCGIDVELANALAAALDAQIEWVETSWKSLLDDLRQQRFDVAMCGVSVTPERAAVGRFTTPYLRTGKTALARCERIDRFRSLADIDRDDVRVIVNPGGSNEAWVRTHLSRAEILVHPDNVSIFAALERGDADVMITDAIEGDSEHARHPALCTSTAPYLAAVEKAWLVPNDAAWTEWLDGWLAGLVADGTLAAVIARNAASNPRD